MTAALVRSPAPFGAAVAELADSLAQIAGRV